MGVQTNYPCYSGNYNDKHQKTAYLEYGKWGGRHPPELIFKTK